MDIVSERFAWADQSRGNGRRELSDPELDALAGSRLFAGIAREQLHRRFRPQGEVSLRPGATLLELGQRNDAIYLLVAGRLAVFLDEGSEVPIAHVEPGESVGEMALLDDEATSALVVAVEPSRLLAIRPDQLWALMREDHAVALNLMEILAARIRRNNTIVGERFTERAQLNLISTIDPVTGLHNRRWFNDMFPRQIDRCARSGHAVCMARVDIDHFRAVNDTFGRRAGQLVLAQVARVMQNQFRASDLLARCGGGEFAVLLPETSLQSAAAALERVRRAVGQMQTSVAQGTTVKVQISAGIAEWREGWSLEDLLRDADRALQSSKAAACNDLRVAAND